MKFSGELTKIRRFLRDPDGAILSDYDIVTYWNDAQEEIFTKTGYIERVHAYKYPPEWTISYMRDWEHTYTDGNMYQCLIEFQALNAEVCYPWEAGYWLDTSTTFDSGARFTHPWESYYLAPADYVPIPLHSRFQNMKLLAFDEDIIKGKDRKEIASKDPFYKTVTGEPVYYYRPDEQGKQLVLYPRPSSVEFDDTSLFTSPLDTFDDAGGIDSWDEAQVDETGKGMISDAIDGDGRVLCIFEMLPLDVTDSPGDWETVELDAPAFWLKYVRAGCLERCYGADTELFIPSLRDYWRLRKEIGLRAIKRYKALRKTDRDYVLGGGMTRARTKHPRLPSEYGDRY